MYQRGKPATFLCRIAKVVFPKFAYVLILGLKVRRAVTIRTYVTYTQISLALKYQRDQWDPAPNGPLPKRIGFHLSDIACLKMYRISPFVKRGEIYPYRRNQISKIPFDESQFPPFEHSISTKKDAF